jgi:hypothetical protein
VKPAKLKTLIVYTLWQSSEVLSSIPEYIEGYRVLVRFSCSLVETPLVKKAELGSFNCLPLKTIPSPAPVVELNINLLTRELDRLEKICGSHTLQDVFYEIHDGKNAVTDMSKRYPEVRTSLEELFATYGFDVIYEEIDG